jgi:hypothetical protein
LADLREPMISFGKAGHIALYRYRLTRDRMGKPCLIAAAWARYFLA